MTETRKRPCDRLPGWARGVERSKRAFLVTDLVAGIALACLILAMAATLLKADLQIRRTREARFRMLLQFENVLARAEATDASKLTQDTVKSFLDELARGDSTLIDIDVIDLPGKPAGKRVVLKSNVSSSQAGSVFLMRDFFGQERRP